MSKLTICFICSVGLPVEVFTQYDYFQVQYSVYETYLKVGANEYEGAGKGG
jgi:hypothetical protein